MHKSRSVRPSVSVEMKEFTVYEMHASHKTSIRRITMELGIPKSTVGQILKQESFIQTSYKSCITWQRMTRIYELMCQWFGRKTGWKHMIHRRLFYLPMMLSFMRMVRSTDKVNVRYYWSQYNPYFVDYSEQSVAQKVMFSGTWTCLFWWSRDYAENST